jgi:hypothetical protein
MPSWALAGIPAKSAHNNAMPPTVSLFMFLTPVLAPDWRGVESRREIVLQKNEAGARKIYRPESHR